MILNFMSYIGRKDFKIISRFELHNGGSIHNNFEHQTLSQKESLKNFESWKYETREKELETISMFISA